MDITLRRGHMKFIFEWIKYLMSEYSEQVKSFFHKKILHRYECFENKKLKENKGKNKGMTS